VNYLDKGTIRLSMGNIADIKTSVSRMLLHVVLFRAATLARHGHYSEAETILKETVKGGEEMPAFLDLLARIRAQQWKLLDAKSFWTQASRLDPTNKAYKAGLERIARIGSRPLWLVWLGTNFFSIILFAMVIGIFFAGFFMRGNLLNLNQPPKKEVEKVTVKTDFLTDLKITAPGISVTTEMNEINFKFNSGLFTSGVDITPENKKLLTTLGKQLEPHSDHVLLKVIGYADDIPIIKDNKFKDNSALGIARAVAVVDHLRATTKLKPEIFLIGSLGESTTPYPNDTPQNRARNRTVVIKISRTKDYAR
jgi:flagellar motor protein MotB